MVPAIKAESAEAKNTRNCRSKAEDNPYKNVQRERVQGTATFCRCEGKVQKNEVNNIRPVRRQPYLRNP
jgi:hypothetical protein